MKSLAQIRAAHASHYAATLCPKHVAKLPPLIVNNGLLAALAFTLDEKRQPLYRAMSAVADHLAKQRLVDSANASPEDVLVQLAKAPDAAPLQRATTEALAYLAYLKRFARAPENA